MRGLPFSVMAWMCVSILNVDSFAQTDAKAKPGNPEKQYELATKYETGDGVERSLETAIELYERAAQQGHSQSMLRLGILYHNGEVLGGTIKADNELAWLWFTFATAHGQPQATTDAERIAKDLHPSILRDLKMHAAETLVEGNEVPARADKGIELYRSLAEEGSAKAAEILGTLYMEGKLMPRQPGLASAWYEKAAAAGSFRAMYELAKIAESESPPNFANALELYRKAARKGDARSMYRLGEMYTGGLGVTRDLVLAHAWFTAAGYFKLDEGTAAARKLEPELSRAQIEKAQLETHKLIASSRTARTLATTSGIGCQIPA